MILNNLNNHFYLIAIWLKTHCKQYQNLNQNDPISLRDRRFLSFPNSLFGSATSHAKNYNHCQ